MAFDSRDRRIATQRACEHVYDAVILGVEPDYLRVLVEEAIDDAKGQMALDNPIRAAQNDIVNQEATKGKL